MPLSLVVAGLGAKRGEDLIFKDISFVLEAGEALIITGPNGSGKSTLLRVVAGLLLQEEGTVSATGGTQEFGHPRELCHYLGHHNGMKRELTVEENLTFWKKFMGDSADGTGMGVFQAEEAVDLPGIGHLPFGYLSAGQQRRIAFAKLLVAHRPVWILDEPTAALDSAADTLLAKLISAHQRSGGIVLAATHQPLALQNASELAMTGFIGLSD
ncbi:heme exporter protein A [Pararhizobium capsulatum DSM 1112]|uniref:Heme exporter protein A n=1 Tax=Pararhizobium capsulatum DSM 1112 TaxID=1121113 RepID=A0ABU0BIE5_9HYPH|nr:heme ABC exporter ATP-binding protein CcmA [Pararhizobium capsulatum]MDQ0318031.1 heme exporter protein A [Pararhizobium capsulatum DSM 1112]